MLAHDPSSQLFYFLKRNDTPFQGIDYMDTLRSGAIYHGGSTIVSKGFLNFVDREPKKAVLLETGDIPWLKRVLERKFPQKRCPAGEVLTGIWPGPCTIQMAKPCEASYTHFMLQVYWNFGWVLQGQIQTLSGKQLPL